VANILKAAANPNAETPDVILATLEPERRRLVDGLKQETSAQMLTVHERGKMALLSMSDDEWNALNE